MSRLGKILMLVAGFSILAAGLVRTVLGVWHNSLYIGVGLFFVCFVVSLIRDAGFYKEFLTMRTTKHGMNMGVLILLFVTGLAAVNYLSVRKNKKWDLTAEKLNSLSDQTVKVLNKIDGELKIHFFYRGGTEGVHNVRNNFKDLVEKYKAINSKVSVRFVDSLKRPALAKEYGVDKATAMVFVDYKGKRNSVEALTEEGLTLAFLKATRSKNKKIIMTTGHGEKLVKDKGPTGVSEFEKALKDSGYEVSTINLLDQKISEDTELVLILGPQTSFVEAETKALRDYARAGGKLFIAIDPGQRHNLANLTKVFGVEFKNDYVLDQFGQILGASAAMSLGRSYGSTSITKDFAGRMTMFHLASSVKRADSSQYDIQDVVLTGDSSFTTDEISQGQVEVQVDRKGPHRVALASEGILPADGKKVDVAEKENSESDKFRVVVFGDSDFLTNQLLFQQMNRDLALNSVAYLMKESSLISIRPKQPKGTTLTLTQTQFWTFFLGIILPIPLVLFGMSGFFWYRRRSA